MEMTMTTEKIVFCNETQVVAKIIVDMPDHSSIDDLDKRIEVLGKVPEHSSRWYQTIRHMVSPSLKNRIITDQSELRTENEEYAIQLEMDKTPGLQFFHAMGGLHKIMGEEISMLVDEWCEPAEAKELTDAVAKLAEAAEVICRIKHRYKAAFDEFCSGSDQDILDLPKDEFFKESMRRHEERQPKVWKVVETIHAQG
jgi:hypothetical protein